MINQNSLMQSTTKMIYLELKLKLMAITVPWKIEASYFISIKRLIIHSKNIDLEIEILYFFPK